MLVLWKLHIGRNGQSFCEALDELRIEHNNRLAQLEQISVRKLRIEEEFERADMADIYRSVYQYSCSEVHGTIGALFNRHLVFEEPRPYTENTILNDSWHPPIQPLASS